jgi:hypothetical protein
MIRNILYLLFASYFAGFGILFTIRPEKVRDFIVRQYTIALSSLKELGVSFSVDRYIPRASLFRAMGAASLIASVLIIYSWLRD